MASVVASASPASRRLPPARPASPSSDAGTPPVSPAAGTPPSPPDARRYRWLAADNLKFPAAVDSLETRFPTPPGYTRIALSPGSFGEWLRGLPWRQWARACSTTAGMPPSPQTDDYVAAVVAIDVGAGDLQQSADAVVRLHGEWLWSNDQRDAIGYRSSTKLDMPFSRWAKGSACWLPVQTCFGW